MLVIEAHDGRIIEIEPPQLLDFSLDNSPPKLQETLKEAIACHGAGAYRAAAMMVRRLLEEICEENKVTGPSTTLADLLTPLFVANPFSAVRASFLRQSSDEGDDGVADGRQTGLRRRSIDSFSPPR